METKMFLADNYILISIFLITMVLFCKIVSLYFRGYEITGGVKTLFDISVFDVCLILMIFNTIAYVLSSYNYTYIIAVFGYIFIVYINLEIEERQRRKLARLNKKLSYEIGHILQVFNIKADEVENFECKFEYDKKFIIYHMSFSIKGYSLKEKDELQSQLAKHFEVEKEIIKINVINYFNKKN